MLEDLKEWRGRLLWSALGSSNPDSVGELAAKAEAPAELTENTVKELVRHGVLVHRRTGYEVAADKRRDLEAWVEAQLFQLGRSGRLLFVSGTGYPAVALRERMYFLAPATQEGRPGILWMGRTSRVSDLGTDAGTVTMDFPGSRRPLQIDRCPVAEGRETGPSLALAVSPTSARTSPPDEPMLQEMVRALDDEIPFAREDQVRIVASKGVFEALAGNQYIYRFTIDHFQGDSEARPVLPDDSPIQVQIGKMSFRGVLQGQSPGELSIALDQDLGRGDTGPAMIISSPAELLEAMKRAIKLSPGDGRDSRLANAVFSSRPDMERFPPDRLPKSLQILNPEQQEAVGRTIQAPVTFIWGPPGTGKTFTLGHAIAALRGLGKRVLLVSHTNVAADTLLLSVVAQLGSTEDFSKGRILRYGVPYKPELKKVAEVLPERVAERLNPSLVSKRKALEKELASLEQRLLQLGKEPASAVTRRKIAEVKEETKRVALQIVEIRRQLTAQGELLVTQAAIVACTLTKAYLSSLLASQQFDVVVIDEASMAPLPALWLVLRMATVSAVLVGDFRQLGPIAKGETDVVHRWLKRDIFAAAGIEGAVEKGMPDPRLVMLKEQRRMHPAISSVPNTYIYGGKLRDYHPASHFAEVVAQDPFPGKPLGMVDTGSLLPWNSFTESGSRFNMASALTSLRLAQMAKSSGVKTVAIITPFAAQARLLRRLIKDARLKDLQVDAATVHRFQGDERDLIIFDAVADQPSLRLGRLLEGSLKPDAARLLNVAWTRARGKLLLVGNVRYLKSVMDKSAAMSPFFWEARSTGDFDATGLLTDYPQDLGKPSQLGCDLTGISYTRRDALDAAFLADVQTARQVVAQFPDNLEPYAYYLAMAHTRGAEVSVLTGRYSPAVDLLQKAGVRVGFSDECPFLAWLDNRIVWFGRTGPNGKELYFRHVWPSTASDLWSLTGMEGLLLEADSPVSRIAQRIIFRGVQRCPDCEERMRLRSGLFGFYWVCEAHKQPIKQTVSEALLNLAVAEAGFACPQHGATMQVRKSRNGVFLACGRCRNTQSIGL